MAQEFFSFDKLATLDGGRIQQAVDLELERMRLDCEDRPSLDQARTVTLTIVLQPEADDTGELLDVRLHCHVKSATPKRQTRGYRLAAGRGALIINELAPENARQMTIDHLKPPTPTQESKAPNAG